MLFMHESKSLLTTVILAGGLGKRIGGDKGLQLLQGRPLIRHVLESVAPHSSAVLINANTTLEAYKPLACRIITDEMPDWQGPLAGLHAALLNAQTEYVLTVPCDTPFLPHDLVARLQQAVFDGTADAAVAMAGGRRQPTIALYNRRVLPRLQAYLDAGKRKVNDWLDSLQLSEVVFDNVAAFDNINTREDLERANRVTMTQQCNP